MKIIIIGPYPPPYGGISVNIKRIKKYLEKKNIEAVVYDESKNTGINNVIPIKKYKFFIFKILFLKADVIHFHSLDKKVRIFLGMYKALGKRVVLTVHGESLNNQIRESNFFVRQLLLKSLKKIDKIICVNPKNREELLKLGFNPNKVEYIPSYINPIEDKFDFDNIPINIKNFMNESKFLISSNGCIRFHNNEDLYGFDMMIELIDRLSKNKIEVNLLLNVLAVEEQNDLERKYYNRLKSRVKELKLEDKICIFEVENTEFYPILKESNLFIRPTNTDGFGVSIAEAIYYNVPAIASDVCKRPDGTVIFKSRDFDDLYEKTINLINNNEKYVKSVEKISYEDFAGKVLNIYKSIVIDS